MDEPITFPYGREGWNPPYALDDQSPADPEQELRDMNPAWPVMHLLGDLEHRQWIAMFEPWMHSVPLDDSDYARLMKKSFEDLTPEEREFYCTRWARLARAFIENEMNTGINARRFELMERAEWDQTTHWVKYMFEAWDPDNVQRWRMLARTRYAKLTEKQRESDQDMAWRQLEAIGIH